MNMVPQPIRVAFIGIDHPHGAGWRAALGHLPNEFEIVALVPRFAGGLASLEERWAGLPRFDTVEKLLDWNQFQAAVVCLPNDESPQELVALLAAGKGVLAEKPGAGNYADFAPVEAAAEAAVEAAGAAFQSGYMWRYDLGAERLRRMVRDGSFGRMVSVEIRSFTSDVARRGPGHYLFDPHVSKHGYMNWLACHWLDLLFDVVGEAVTAVTARVGCFGGVPIQVEDGGAALFELEGGGLASFHGGYFLPRWAGENQWSLHGTQRWVNWSPTHPQSSGVLDIHGPQPQFDAMNERFTLPVDDTPGYGGRRCRALLVDWAASIREPGRPCRNTPRSMGATLRLIDAVYQASSEGRRLEGRIEP